MFIYINHHSEAKNMIYESECLGKILDSGDQENGVVFR